jgi:hypothetical protein
MTMMMMKENMLHYTITVTSTLMIKRSKLIASMTDAMMKAQVMSQHQCLPVDEQMTRSSQVRKSLMGKRAAKQA